MVKGLFTALFAYLAKNIYICQRTRLFGYLSLQSMFMRYTSVTDFVQLLSCYDCCPLLGLQRRWILWQTTFFVQSWYGDGLSKQVLLISHLRTFIFFFLSSSSSFLCGKYETEWNRLLVNEIENKLDNHNRRVWRRKNRGYTVVITCTMFICFFPYAIQALVFVFVQFLVYFPMYKTQVNDTWISRFRSCKR